MNEETTVHTPAPQDTSHEAHHHAGKRLTIGILAVVVLAVAGYVWATWGDAIKDVCFGKDGACPIQLEGLPATGAPVDGAPEPVTQ